MQYNLTINTGADQMILWSYFLKYIYSTECGHYNASLSFMAVVLTTQSDVKYVSNSSLLSNYESQSVRLGIEE